MKSLLQQAAAAGYVATFTIEAHPAGPTDQVMKLPRILLTNSAQGNTFARIVGATERPAAKAPEAAAKAGTTAPSPPMLEKRSGSIGSYTRGQFQKISWTVEKPGK